MLLSWLLTAGCGQSSGPEGASETPITVLDARYDVELQHLGGRCDLGSFELDAMPLRAKVEQDGNLVTWSFEPSVASEVAMSEVWRMAGRLCPESSGVTETSTEANAEIRMKGGRVYRLSMGDDFCRAELRLPADGAGCPTDDDLCFDPATVKLNYDACSGRWYGQFWGCVAFGEACTQYTDTFSRHRRSA